MPESCDVICFLGSRGCNSIECIQLIINSLVTFQGLEDKCFTETRGGKFP